MTEIKGRVNTALCYAKTVDEIAMEQIRRMCDQEFTRDSKIRIMPDVHAGMGCTIGTTMTVHDKVVPNIVGVDIGCGMYTVELGRTDIDLALLDEAVHRIPSGREIRESKIETFDLKKLRCYSELKHYSRLEKSLGTLGGGNHFIEVESASDGRRFLVIHSGSRNLGKQVAEYYQAQAVELLSGKEDYQEKRVGIISEYKASGKKEQIQSALQKLKQEYEKMTPSLPEDLCYVSGRHLEDYLHDVEICQSFARRNREIMAESLLERLKLKALSSFHSVHNYIDTQERILRKGAIAAYKGETVLIPINMRDGSVLAKGKGNPEWNCSAPHGAGRIMSRKDAKERISMESYQSAMEGIYSTSVCEETVDEAPQAYKSLSDILEVIRESVDATEILKPIYNFKAPN